MGPDLRFYEWVVFRWHVTGDWEARELGCAHGWRALEAFQDFGRGVLPESELRARRLALVAVPGGSPDAADLVAPKARGAGVTAALWAGQDRALTQSWADALRRAGWQALWYGLQHDPSGQLRGVALFDLEGEHAPYGDETWKHTILRLDHKRMTAESKSNERNGESWSWAALGGREATRATTCRR